MIQRTYEGHVMRLRAVAHHSRWKVFRDLIREFAEPADVLRTALGLVPGVDAAFIYGSFARKTDIHPASDVDLFVIGDTIDQETVRTALAEATLEASGILGREVNLSRYTPEKLAARKRRGGQFLKTVLAGEKEWLIGDESTLAGIPNHARRRSARNVS
jgi:predicted nucleotidyltransferase